MTTFYGGTDFNTLYFNFINGDTFGKIFMMKSYETESVHWGKGAVLNLYQATPFLLNIIFEWSFENPKGFIGDVETFYKLIHENGKREIKKIIQNSHHSFKTKTKRMLSLRNILRKQKSFRKKKVKKVTV